MEYEARTQYFDFVGGYSNKNVYLQQKSSPVVLEGYCGLDDFAAVNEYFGSERSLCPELLWVSPL
jgi:hypothetical protein